MALHARLPALALSALLVLLGGCEEQHGFLKVGSSLLFDDADSLACGEARIIPKADGLLDAFVTLAPQDCSLTLHRAGDFLGVGRPICKLHIANNRITSVYLTGQIGALSCSIASG